MEMTDKKLTKILTCPDCLSFLEISKGQLVCSNKDCSQEFPIKQRIPILLSERAPDSKEFLFKKAQIDFFDRWSSKDRGGQGTGKTALDRFFSPVVGEKRINYSEEEMRRAISQFPPGSLVLELGCGAGEHTAFLAKLRDDIHLVAIDLSLKSIIETKRRIKNDKRIKSRVSFVVADAESLPFKDDVFVGIMAVMFFHHLASCNKTLKEIKRTLRSRGIALVVDLTADNPLLVLSRKIFPYLPFWMKKRLKQDYLLEDGEVPEVRLHEIEEIKDEIKRAKLKIIKEEKHDLFLFILSPMGAVFPWIKHLIPEFVLNFLYNFEKRLLKNSFWQKFAGATTLWISH